MGALGVPVSIWDEVAQADSSINSGIVNAHRIAKGAIFASREIWRCIGRRVPRYRYRGTPRSTTLLWRCRGRRSGRRRRRRDIPLGRALGESPSVLGLHEAVAVRASRKNADGLGAEIDEHQINSGAGFFGISGDL